MIHKGMFGELLHGECGYLYDLRGLLVSQTVYQGMWRWHRQTTMNGNLYPTHGIGPMSWCMDINRGDAFDYMVSFSTNARGHINASLAFSGMNCRSVLSKQRNSE